MDSQVTDAGDLEEKASEEQVLNNMNGNSILPYPKPPSEMTLREHIAHFQKERDACKKNKKTEAKDSIMNGRYKKLIILGEGTYGVVYKARGLGPNAGRMFAVKEVRNVSNDGQGLPCTTIREIAALQELKHPNLVELLDTMISPDETWLVFEYCDVDLHKFMSKVHAGKSHISDDLVKQIMRQIVDGMDYIHQRRYLHRDLKPQNVLYNVNSGIVKIADFGLARLCGIPTRVLTHEIETLWYRAPEVLIGSSSTGYGIGVDIWSIGCILAELFCKHPFFEGESEIHQLYTIFQVLGTPTEEVWEGVSDMPHYQYAHFPKWDADRDNYTKRFSEHCKNRRLPERRVPESAYDLLQKCFSYTPGVRIICKDMLKHPFFEGVVNIATSDFQHTGSDESDDAKFDKKRPGTATPRSKGDVTSKMKRMQLD